MYLSVNMDHNTKVLSKTVKYIESLLESLFENEDLAEILNPLKDSLESDNSTLESINQRVSFLSEILALKKQVNSVSTDRLKTLEQANNKLEKELDEIKNQSFLLPVTGALDFDKVKNEIAQLEEQHDLLNQCISQQLCLSCLNKF